MPNIERISKLIDTLDSFDHRSELLPNGERWDFESYGKCALVFIPMSQALLGDEILYAASDYLEITHKDAAAVFKRPHGRGDYDEDWNVSPQEVAARLRALLTPENVPHDL